MDPGTPRRKLDRRQLIERLKSIRLLTLDVDGVLTDGGLYYADDGRQLRKFNVKDGLGMQRAMAMGVDVALVSAGKTASIQLRAETLGIRHVLVGVEDKLSAVESLSHSLGVDMGDVAHMGDDLNDLPVLARVGLPLTVADAVEAVRAVAAFVTERRGGEGAVRELCDLIAASRSAV